MILTGCNVNKQSPSMVCIALSQREASSDSHVETFKKTVTRNQSNSPQQVVLTQVPLVPWGGMYEKDD